MAKVKKDTIEEYHLNRHQPDKDQFVIHDLHTYLRKNQPDTLRPHIHSYYQIIWFQSGTGQHFVDFVSHQVNPQTIFFIDKNQVHCFDEQANYTGYLLHFNEHFLTGDQQSDTILKHHLFSNPDQQPYSTLSKDYISKLQVIISQIQEELTGTTTFGKPDLLRTFLKSFLILVYRSKMTNPVSAAEPLLQDEKRMQFIRFFNLVEQHYKEGLTVSEYARLMYISPRSLSDLTHQQINKTPSQMIQERIILEAQRLLVHSNLNISQVAYRTGFDDPSYFVKFFKKHTGMSPSDFKKTIA